MQTTLPILMPLIQLDIEYGITGAPVAGCSVNLDGQHGQVYPAVINCAWLRQKGDWLTRVV